MRYSVASVARSSENVVRQSLSAPVSWSNAPAPLNLGPAEPTNQLAHEVISGGPRRAAGSGSRPQASVMADIIANLP